MSITSAIVLFAVIWFMTLFIVLPFRQPSQSETGEVVPGTPPGAPAHFKFKKRAWWTTGIAAVLWALIAGTIWSGKISVRDIDMLNVMPPLSSEGAGTDG